MIHPPSLGAVVVSTGLACAAVVTCGQALMDRATAAKVEQLRQQLAASVEIFQDRYGYRPGDFPAATGEAGSAWADLAAAGLVDRHPPALRGISRLTLITRNGHLDLAVEGAAPRIAAALKAAPASPTLPLDLPD